MRVVGVCDRDPVRRDAITATLRHAGGFAENEEMLDATSPDLLVIATPPSVHLGEIAAAASRGVHVLCEKPLGLSHDDVTALRELALQQPALAMATVHQYRFAGPWSWMTRAAAGALQAGEPFTIHVLVERPGTDPLSAGGWRADPEHEGGILGDHAVHYLALFELLDPGCSVTSCRRQGQGGREVASVEARIGTTGVGGIDVSYAGSGRSNVMRMHRPAQCLELDWTNADMTIGHDGAASPPRAVASLSDRAVVNGLYAPMYAELISHLFDRAWRAQATGHTIGAAALLARAIELAR